MVASIANTTPNTNNHSHASVRARGAATQNRILEKAVHIASVEGLSSMSLATLAKATSMSKSGLFAHFRSKEALQIAIIDEAERIFFDAVVRPAHEQPPGIDRLALLVDGYAAYCARGPFEGGCFFAAAAHEFDGRPGQVRNRVIAYFDTWATVLRTAAIEAGQRAQLREGIDVEELIFEVQAIGLAANVTAQIGGGVERAKLLSKEAARSLVERIAAAKN
jgi:AcrR family transcriptional regulator